MYKAINGYTKQKMIDVVNEKFKGKAYCDIERMCKYLTDDGKSCAVGIFIPDNHKGLKFEGDAICLIDTHKDLVNILPLIPEGLEEFQLVHDVDTSKLTNEELKLKLITWIKNNVTDK